MHGEESARLEQELTEVNRQLSDIESAHAEALERIHELESALANEGSEQAAEIRAALAAGNFSKADTLLAGIEDEEQGAVERTAEASYQRGIIAMLQVRWKDAATHFDRAARLGPTYERLNKAGDFAVRMANYETASHHLEKLLGLSRLAYGEKSSETAAALNNYAVNLRAIGRYGEAEQMFREVSEIGREILDDGHPDRAIQLNNLGNVLQDMGRYDEAERLYREALDTTGKTSGVMNPDYAVRLNNLASLLRITGGYAEAERLLRQALDITRQTLGDKHPDYGTCLNNLGSLLVGTGRHDDAESLFRESADIMRQNVGEKHPDYATGLNNLANALGRAGRLEEAEVLCGQALQIFRETLGDGHPNTIAAAGGYAELLRARCPGSRKLVELESAFGEALGRMW